jgi:hypothetical protein
MNAPKGSGQPFAYAAFLWEITEWRRLGRLPDVGKVAVNFEWAKPGEDDGEKA